MARVVDERAAAVIPVAGELGEDPGEYVVDGPRQAGTGPRRRDRRLLHVRPHDRGAEVLLVREAPGQALVEHAAERVLVGHAEHRHAADLLRRDVVDGAEQRTGGGQPRYPVLVLRDAEVGEVYVLGVALV